MKKIAKWNSYSPSYIISHSFSEQASHLWNEVSSDVRNSPIAKSQSQSEEIIFFLPPAL